MGPLGDTIKSIMVGAENVEQRLPKSIIPFCDPDHVFFLV